MKTSWERPRATHGAISSSRASRPDIYAVFGEKTGFQASTAIVTVEAGTIATATLTLTAEKALEVSVTAERLTPGEEQPVAEDGRERICYNRE